MSDQLEIEATEYESRGGSTQFASMRIQTL